MDKICYEISIAYRNVHQISKHITFSQKRLAENEKVVMKTKTVAYKKNF
jgi:hypothetical protein